MNLPANAPKGASEYTDTSDCVTEWHQIVSQGTLGKATVFLRFPWQPDAKRDIGSTSASQSAGSMTSELPKPA
jgi:hypothetical protein